MERTYLGIFLIMADSFLNQPGLPVGLRNNNPGNIRPQDGVTWDGSIGSSGGFVQFSDITWGLRAMATALTNMINGGLDTITSLITQWSTTDQASYIANVSACTGIDPSDQLGTDNDTLASLIRCMMNQELGDTFSQMVPDADIQTGISMMGSGSPGLAIQAAPATPDNSNTTLLLIAALAVGAAIFFSRD